MSDPVVRAQAQALLAQYDRVSAEWSRLNDELSETENVPVTEGERYSVALELLAHDFAAVVRDMVKEA